MALWNRVEPVYEERAGRAGDQITIEMVAAAMIEQLGGSAAMAAAALAAGAGVLFVFYGSNAAEPRPTADASVLVIWVGLASVAPTNGLSTDWRVRTR